MAPDSKTLIDSPSGPSGSTIAGILLFGLIARKSGVNWSAGPDVDGMDIVGEPDLLEHDGRFAPVGCRRGIEFDHRAFP